MSETSLLSWINPSILSLNIVLSPLLLIPLNLEERNLELVVRSPQGVSQSLLTWALGITQILNYQPKKKKNMQGLDLDPRHVCSIYVAWSLCEYPSTGMEVYPDSNVCLCILFP